MITGVEPSKRGVHGGRINEWLENGAGGTLGDGVIKLAECVVATADQCKNLTGVRIHHHHRDLGLRTRFNFGFVLSGADFDSCECAFW